MSKQMPDSALYHTNREFTRQRKSNTEASDLTAKGLRKEMQIKTTIVFKMLSESTKLITLFQGGSRSGKTVNIILWFIIKLLSEENKVLSICRASLPTIRGTVLRDFREQMLEYGLWDDNCFNQTQLTYELGSNLIEFISIDQPQKIRGRKRDYLFMNEVNEVDKEAALQLMLRTTGKIVMDYNPSDDDGWWYEYQDSPKSDFYITTYKDNPFLEDSLVERIEELAQADENYWRIYGLGLRGVPTHKIYNHWRIVPRFPLEVDETVFGLDFGFNVATALVRIGFKDRAVFVAEEIYERKMTTADLIARIDSLGIPRDSVFYCDSAAAESMEELIRAGVNAVPALKDVVEGIKKVMSRPLYVTEYSTNFIAELKRYSWELDKKGEKTDKPVKHFDHLCDATRYGIYTHSSLEEEIWGVI